MNEELPKSVMAMRHPDGAVRYADPRSTGIHQTHQHISKEAHRMSSNGPGKPVGPMISTKELPLRERSDRSSSSSASSTSPIKSHKESALQFCLCQPDPKIPRPRNAFILYRQHYQAMVVAHNPGLANPEISKIIGEQWRSLSEEDKSKWKALAEEEKARHQQQYPDYRYQPRRYGRDGSARSSATGIGHNPSGSSHCNRCGGRLMNAPASPMTPFTPSSGPGFRPSNFSPHPSSMPPRSVQGHEKDPNPPKSAKMDHDPRSRQRHWEEPGGRSPDNKRRRVSQASFKPTLHPYRDHSPGNGVPESPHPMTPWSARPEMPPRHLPMLQPQRPYQSVQGQSHPDPSLKLPPLQTTTPVMTPMTPYPQEGSSVEATVMTIPFLNKIKVLAKISPPLLPSFRDGIPPARGPVIAVDGQDPDLVQAAVEYLNNLLKKETKYHVRVFDGPEIKAPRPTSAEAGQMGDATVDYLNTISAWHRISDEVVNFVKPTSRAGSVDARSITTDEETPVPNVSPRTLIPKTANMHIHSPALSSENGSEVSTLTSASHYSVPIALVPRYQLTTADAFACSTPIGDSYAPLDHWQWMASLWRACVGPDITVYIRECSKEELDRIGGNPVEVRLQDVRTVVLRKVVGRDLEEKALKRMGFEIEDFLTQ
ncbi:transcriptional regulator family: HMG [Penicillium roqueforti]|nr:transcriptional regulator family: HMG [Penicillium roqueforti]KAI3167183.1 transcriptional regulator family: HMG [Penicillium roqueforti]